MEKTIKSHLLHQGRSFSFKTDEVELHNGRTTTRDIVDHPGAVAVLPLLSEGRIALIRQYRYSVGKELLEIPAGTLEEGESPDSCARRELKEETGFTARSMKKILNFYVAPGYSNEKIHLFLASDLKMGKKQAEEDESIIVETYGYDELLRMIDANEIEDAKTIVGILAFLTK